MTDQGERYDRIAAGYARWWAPVLRPAALALLDLVAEDASRARTAVDVGTGTGTLATAAADRWRQLEVIAVDASDEMLAAARQHASRAVSERVSWLHGRADRLPLPDAAADLVVSSFVYQLVPSRTRALREAVRVLRPGGRLGYVTWLAATVDWAPDAAFDDALEAVGLEPRGDPENDGRAGDVPSARAGATQARRAGLREVRGHEGAVRHDFTPDSYLAFLAEFDEEDRFRALDPERRARLEAELLARLRSLSRDQLRLELPVVYVTGRRDPDG